MQSRFVILLASVLPAVLVSTARSDEARKVVVVCPPALREGLREWVTYREQQGYVVDVLDPADRMTLRHNIRQVMGSDRHGAVVLVGDAPRLANPSPPSAATLAVESPTEPSSADSQRANTVPTWYVPAAVTPHWGGESHIATDTPYGDLDDDGLPDLAVGRLPARSEDMLKGIVAKTVEYERQGFGQWRRQIQVVASSGGFGPIVDGAIERVTQQFLTHRIPAAYLTDVAFADWHSPYCPNLFDLREHTVQSLGEGSLAWVFLGHGRPDQLVAAPAAPLPALAMLAGDDAFRIPANRPRTIAFLLACYTSAFDAPQACLAECLLQAPGGPVAVLGGTRLTMPYGMAVLGTEILHQWFDQPADTLGEMVVKAKRSMLDAPDAPRTSKWLDAIAWPLHPQRSQLAEERREHVQLFQLLGDPLLRMNRPLAVTLQTDRVAQAGQPCRISGTSPVAGKAIVELTCRRDQFTFVPAARTQPANDQQAGLAMEQLRQRANDRRWCATEVDVPAGVFSVVLAVPATAHGPSYARVFVEGKENCALGAVALQITPSSIPGEP